MDDGTADISNAVELHNVYGDCEHECAAPAMVNELRQR